MSSMIVHSRVCVYMFGFVHLMGNVGMHLLIYALVYDVARLHVAHGAYRFFYKYVLHPQRCAGFDCMRFAMLLYVAGPIGSFLENCFYIAVRITASQRIFWRLCFHVAANFFWVERRC